MFSLVSSNWDSQERSYRVLQSAKYYYLCIVNGLDEAQAAIKIARRNINNLRYVDDTTLMAESEEELKSLLMKVKAESSLVVTRGWRIGKNKEMMKGYKALVI